MDENTQARKRTVRKKRPTSPGEGTERPVKRNAASQERRKRTSQKRADRPRGNGKRRPTSNERRPERQTIERMPERQDQPKKKKKNFGCLIGFLLILLVIIAAVGGIYFVKYGPSKGKADLNKYYGLESDDQLAVVVNDAVIGAGGKVVDNVPYLEYTCLRENVNSRFYWDANENLLLYTLPSGTITVGADTKDYMLGEEQRSMDNTIWITDGSSAYISLDFVQQFTDMESVVSENPNRVMIVTKWGDTQVATIKKDTAVRYQAGVKSPVLTDVKKSDKVTFVEDQDDWTKVRTSDGFIGYIKDAEMSAFKTESINSPGTFEAQDWTSDHIKKDYKINMVWHNVDNEVANSYLSDSLSGTSGITTIAPTWFSIADTEGNLSSLASADYVNTAHQAGLEVWAVCRDFQGGVTTGDEVTQVLSVTSKRTNLINQLVTEAVQKGVDGINLDFELIQEKTGDAFCQFIRELSLRCRENNLAFSIDNYVPMPYNTHYDLTEQGNVADYVVIMGYDEHTAGSEEAGSVASYDYVKTGIENTIKKVPADQVINGVPFYTRLWFTGGNGLESSTIGMADAIQKLSDVGVTASWDDEAKQNYATWSADGGTYQIWMEDAQSLTEKLKLIQEDGLAGVAEWRLGYETSDIWGLISQYNN